MADAKSQQILKKDLQRLREMLEIAAPVEAIQRKHSQETRILDLACGACHEAQVLVDHFGNPLHSTQSAPQVQLVGMDVRGREIDEAKAQFKGDQKTDFQFFEGDARSLKDHREVPDDFDIVFMRHQNYWNHTEVWKGIFDQGFEKLHKNGLLVITSYFEKEHLLAVNALKELGGELVTEVDNPQARSLITPGKRIDQKIAVFRKS